MSKYTHNFSDKNILSASIINGKAKNWVYGNNISNEKIIIQESRVNVFYNYYRPKQEERYREIIFCFDQLLKNKNIDNFYVLCSDDLKIENDKLIKIRIYNQPKFKDFFNLIDFYTQEEDINIILNSDCYIDEENITQIINKLDIDDAYLLSRWDILKLKPFTTEHFNIINKDNTGCSQDAWIFRGNPKNELVGDFEMGKAGCDNVIAHQFDLANYNISNPSYTIKVYHYHLSKIRTYGNYGDGFDNREKDRIPPPYKFIPSTGFITENMKIVFYNHYHNGDIHYSREFIKDIMNKFKSKEYSYYFNLEHVADKDIIKDINIKIINTLPYFISEKEPLKVIDNTIYINTWVGQKDYEYVHNYGINLKANYQIYKDIYKQLNIKLEDVDFYIPTINYSYFDVSKINKFLKDKEKTIKVLISNGITRSAQCENFDWNDAINEFSSIYKDVVFILTDSKNRIDKKNIFYTSDIINKKFDLNEISYLSMSCDLIIGRASGPYAFSQTKETLLDSKKNFICFCDKSDFEWYISKECKHVTINKYKTDDIISEISKGVDYVIENKNKKIIRRVAFTIILNGLHHLKHNNYADFISKHFDYWVIVEGASQNKGSTSWCKEMPSKYHKNGRSIDGTVEYIKDLQKKYHNVVLVHSNGMWESKDIMVNRAIEEVQKITSSCMLWQIDIDEQWAFDQILKSEKELKDSNCKTGKFEVFQFVGHNLVIDGKDWSGEPFIRLWNWSGEKFNKHEPPTLDTLDKSIKLLSERMRHYAFYFEQDVKFKDEWYTDHEGLYENWLKLKHEKILPQHITYLFPKFKGSLHISNSNNLDCRIVKYKGNIKYNTINKLVDKSYVINLERRKDRLEHIKKEFDKIDLDYKVFVAIDGMKLDLDISDVNKGIIGAIRSHTGVVKDAIKNNYQIIAVFEDDIIFCDDFDERLKYYLDNVPNDWDILYLGCHFNGCPSPILTKNIHKITQCYGCFAMIINNKSGLFQKILNVPENAPYDDSIKDILPSINAYVFFPFFVKTLNTVSDISENKNSFSYMVVDKFFRNTMNIPKIIPPPSLPLPSPPSPQLTAQYQNNYVKSNQDICEDFLRGNLPFIIYHNGRLLFDSDSSDKLNLYFYRDYFTLYGRQFSYQGMMIKRK